MKWKLEEGILCYKLVADTQEEGRDGRYGILLVMASGMSNADGGTVLAHLTAHLTGFSKLYV